MQQRLALDRPAMQVARLAMLLELRDVAHHLPPARDLAMVVRMAAAHVVAAVPLEPAARIVFVDPTLLAPIGQRLRGVDAEVVERLILALGRELGAGEPALGEFALA